MWKLNRIVLLLKFELCDYGAISAQRLSFELNRIWNRSIQALIFAPSHNSSQQTEITWLVLQNQGQDILSILLHLVKLRIQMKTYQMTTHSKLIQRFSYLQLLRELFHTLWDRSVLRFSSVATNSNSNSTLRIQSRDRIRTHQPPSIRSWYLFFSQCLNTHTRCKPSLKSSASSPLFYS